MIVIVEKSVSGIRSRPKLGALTLSQKRANVREFKPVLIEPGRRQAKVRKMCAMQLHSEDLEVMDMYSADVVWPRNPPASITHKPEVQSAVTVEDSATETVSGGHSEARKAIGREETPSKLIGKIYQCYDCL